jgi:hypothetical protein
MLISYSIDKLDKEQQKRNIYIIFMILALKRKGTKEKLMHIQQKISHVIQDSLKLNGSSVRPLYAFK